MSGTNDETSSVTGGEILDSIATNLSKYVNDLSALVTITATSDMGGSEIVLTADGTLDKKLPITVKLVALTRMGLDGDIIAVIPAKEGNGGLTREEIMTIHDKNVERGVNNWNNFVDGIVKIIHLAAPLARKPMPNSSNDASKIIIQSPVSSNSQRQAEVAAATK